MGSIAASVCRQSPGFFTSACFSTCFAFALAAACGRKAAGVTMKRQASDDVRSVEEHLTLLQHRAVAHAQRDELLFKAFMETKAPVQAERLVESSQHFQQLIGDLGKELDGLAPLVVDSVSGDVDAARALHRAAAEIAAGLLREARAERSRVAK